MKNLSKLEINPQKLIKNEELSTLRGGEDSNPCGSGFTTWSCTYIPYPGCPEVTGIVCAATGHSPHCALYNVYPEVNYPDCVIVGGDAAN